MASREFRLPDPGEGLVEADIVTWRVAVGETVAINDIIVEIETSKSIVELPSPYAGTVTALLVNEGDTVDVGVPIIRIEDEVTASATAPVTTAPAPVAASAAPAPATPTLAAPTLAAPTQAAPTLAAPAPAGNGGAASSGRVANLVGYGPKTTEARRRPRKVAHGAEPVSTRAHDQFAGSLSTAAPVSRRADDREPLHPEPVAPSGPPLPEPGPAAPEPYLAGGAVLAKPPVRKLAKDLGVDLGTLTGSGPGGVITRTDVEQAGRPRSVDPAPEPVAARTELVASRPAPTHQPPVDQDGDVRVPIKGVRKATAAAMVRSAFTAPHVTEWVTCDVSETMELVQRLRARREFAGVKISPLLVISKAVCIALGRTPELNSFWDEERQEIVLKGAVNLGIAAATPRGLVVPNIKNAQALSLLELAQAINAQVATAREGRTQPADMSAGTFTITNVGTFGVDSGTPILNPGESGILCVGQIARRPWVVGTGTDERIEPRWVTTLAVSFDHRLADGAQGSTFLSTVAQILGDPGLALFF